MAGPEPKEGSPRSAKVLLSRRGAAAIPLGLALAAALKVAAVHDCCCWEHSLHACLHHHLEPACTVGTPSDAARDSAIPCRPVRQKQLRVQAKDIGFFQKLGQSFNPQAIVTLGGVIKARQQSPAGCAEQAAVERQRRRFTALMHQLELSAQHLQPQTVCPCITCRAELSWRCRGLCAPAAHVRADVRSR